MKLLDGKKLAESILKETEKNIRSLPFVPVLADVLVGSDPVSRSYVGIKSRTAAQVGVEFRLVQLPEDISTDDLVKSIRDLNSDQRVKGVIVQLPLPKSIEKVSVLDAIEPVTDIDCIGARNLADFYSGRAKFIPPTAAAIIHMLDSIGDDLSKKSILVVGQGELVGKPIAHMLKQRSLKVSVANRSTPDLEKILKIADIVISGAGRPRLITGDKIKPGAIIIDAGTSESMGSIVGDADFESVSKTAGHLSPVPGGVGPLTVAMLMKNLAKASL